MKKNISLVITAFATLITIQVSAQNTLPSNGNVGIGTNSPSAKLHVYANVSGESNSGYFETATSFQKK